MSVSYSPSSMQAIAQKRLKRAVKPALTIKQAVRICWSRGLLEYKLYDYQRIIYNDLKNHNHSQIISVLNASRRWGKTTVLILFAIIYCIKNPQSEVKIASPTAKSLRKTLFPIVRMLLSDKPANISIMWNAKEECYKFWNGSRLHIHATDNKRHEALRGNASHLSLVDEAAHCNDLKYVVQDILLPQTLTTGGRVILASTPCPNVTQSGEEFKQFCVSAEANGSYYIKTIHDNKSLSDKRIALFCDASGGEDSITWQVEYLCKFITDPAKKLVPEWNKKYIEDFSPDKQYFDYLHKYTSLDLGVKRDFTCMLFGYYNFLSTKLYIMDECTMKNMTTLELVNALKKKEEECFGDRPVYMRPIDTDNPLLCNDMISLHNLMVRPTGKSSLEQMINELRIFIGNGRLVVHPRCKFLLGNLEHGSWAENSMGQQRRDFGRTKEYGHWDGIASLMYLVLNIDMYTNPIPTVLVGNNFLSDSYYKSPYEGFNKIFKKYK